MLLSCGMCQGVPLVVVMVMLVCGMGPVDAWVIGLMDGLKYW